MFNGTSGLSASDVLSLTNRNNDGIFDGNGAWWLIVLVLLFGWGNGGYGGFGGGSGAQMNYVLSSDFATLQRQLSDGFGATESKLDSISNGICSLGYDQLAQMNGINTNILTSSNAIQTQLADCCCKTQSNIKDVNYNIATTGTGIVSAIKDCCCNEDKQFAQSRFDAQQYNCATLQAIDKLGDRIIDYMSNDKLQALRDENQSLKLCASQSAQNQYLVNTLRPAPIPAFNVPSPFYYGGFGTTIA